MAAAMDVCERPLWTLNEATPVECTHENSQLKRASADPLFSAFQACSVPFRAQKSSRGIKRAVLGDAGQYCQTSPMVKRARFNEGVAQVECSPKREVCRGDDEASSRKSMRLSPPSLLRQSHH